MKKLLSALFAFTIILTCLISCAPDREGVDEKYTGPKISSLEYKTTDFMGGAEIYKLLDFSEGSVSMKRYHPYDADYESDYELLHTFDTSLYTAIVDAFYSNGLFDLKEVYTTDEIIMDGGSWRFTVQYENGSKKVSSGTNVSPYEIFLNSDIAFWDITGAEFLGCVPDSYKTAPGFSLTYKLSEELNPSYGYIAIPAFKATWRKHSYEYSGSYKNTTFELQNIETHLIILKPYLELEEWKIKSASLFRCNSEYTTKESVGCTVTSSEIKFTPTTDTNYLLIVEYELGTAEYRFDTTLAK